MGKSINSFNKISVVMPAYRAERFIVESLSRLKKVLDESKYNYEIICVVDGTSKDNTYNVAQKFANKYPKLVTITGYLSNLGKGHAVRYGMAKANGDIVGYIDAGNEINPEGLTLLLEHMKWYSADAVVASKRHPASKVIYPWQRRILSFGYQIAVRMLFGIKIRDTQVGMKFFKRELLEKVMPRLLVKKFAFDIELLAVANYLGFKKIYEAPVELKMKFGGDMSTIASFGFLNTVFNMAWDTLAVFYRLRILNYYADKNKNAWRTPENLTITRK
jgi:glycosyltransferase involved in cell wall biosynthesis